MKRNPNLVPFSHDHHQGLVFVLRLKKGLDNYTSTAILKHYINDFWSDHLSSHFEKEDELFLPFLDAYNDLAITFKNDHKQIRGLIKQLESTEGGDIYIISAQIADRIERHIRFEERHLFPHIEKSLDPGQIEIIGDGLKNHPDLCHNFKPEFWKE